MNLKDILNPKTCEECKFCQTTFEYGPCCQLLNETALLSNAFDYKETVHKGCPLLRIKCENCKHYVKDFDWDICDLNGDAVSKASVPCIEFEEVE